MDCYTPSSKTIVKPADPVSCTFCEVLIGGVAGNPNVSLQPINLVQNSSKYCIVPVEVSGLAKSN